MQNIKAMPEQRYFKIISPPSFLDKYIERAFREAGYSPQPDGDNSDRCVALFIAGNDVRPPLPDDAGGALTLIIQPEAQLNAQSVAGSSSTIIRTPYVVGTGMTGIMRELVAMAGRGSIFHLAGNEARVSVIHAIDVARLAVALSGHSGEFTVSDGTDPTWDELIEALSTRVGHKRISTVSPRAARWLCRIGRIWGGPDATMLRRLSTTDTLITSGLPVDFTPIKVTDYLKNHIYTDEDL